MSEMSLTYSDQQVLFVMCLHSLHVLCVCCVYLLMSQIQTRSEVLAAEVDFTLPL